MRPEPARLTCKTDSEPRPDGLDDRKLERKMGFPEPLLLIIYTHSLQ